MKYEEEEDYDSIPVRPRNNLVIGGAGLCIGVGTLFNFFWSQIHENSTDINKIQIQAAQLTERSTRHDDEIKDLFARLATCK